MEYEGRRYEEEYGRGKEEEERLVVSVKPELFYSQSWSIRLNTSVDAL